MLNRYVSSTKELKYICIHVSYVYCLCFSNDYQDGWSALMYASFYGHFKIVTLLLENGARVDVKSNVSFS